MNNEQQYSPLDPGSSQMVTDQMWLQKVPEQYRNIVEQEAEANHVPISTAVRMLSIETSGFNPKAVSPTGAIGMAQMLPSTGADMGYTPEQLMDPQMGIQAGIKYLGKLNEKFGGNEDLVLGAYNMGPGHMNQVLAGKADWTPQGSQYVQRAHQVSVDDPVSHGVPGVYGNNGVGNTSDTMSNLNTASTWGNTSASPFPNNINLQVPDTEEPSNSGGILAMAKQFLTQNNAKRSMLASE